MGSSGHGGGRRRGGRGGWGRSSYAVHACTSARRALGWSDSAQISIADEPIYTATVVAVHAVGLAASRPRIPSAEIFIAHTRASSLREREGHHVKHSAVTVHGARRRNRVIKRPVALLYFLLEEGDGLREDMLVRRRAREPCMVTCPPYRSRPRPA